MAQRKYSKNDIYKKVKDELAELRERKIADAREICSLHPGGVLESLKEMNRDIGFTRDQSQAWLEKAKQEKK